MNKKIFYGIVFIIMLLNIAGALAEIQVDMYDGFESQNFDNWTGGELSTTPISRYGSYGAQTINGCFGSVCTYEEVNYGEYGTEGSRITVSAWLKTGGAGTIYPEVKLVNDSNNLLYFAYGFGSRLDMLENGTRKENLMSNASCSAPAVNSWYNITMESYRISDLDQITITVRNNTHDVVCSLQSNITIDFTDNVTYLKAGLGNGNGGSATYYFDEVYLTTEVPPVSPPDTPSWVTPTPDNDTSSLTQETFNLSSSEDNPYYYMWFDNNTNPTTLVLTNSTTGKYTTSVSNDNMTYYYIGAVFNETSQLFSSNTTVRQWTFNETPIIPPNTPIWDNITPEHNSNDTTQQIFNLTTNGTNITYYMWFSNETPPITMVLNNSNISYYTSNVSNENATYFYFGAVYNASNGLFSDNTSIRQWNFFETTEIETDSLFINFEYNFNNLILLLGILVILYSLTIIFIVLDKQIFYLITGLFISFVGFVMLFSSWSMLFSLFNIIMGLMFLFYQKE